MTSRAVYWKRGRPSGHHLEIVLGDIVEVFCVLVDLLEESPVLFDLSQVLLGAVLLAPGAAGDTFLAPDLTDRPRAAAETLDGDDRLGAEAFVGPPQLHKLSAFFGRRGVGGVVGTSRELAQSPVSVLLPSAVPLAHGVARGVEVARRGLQSPSFDREDHLVAQNSRVFTFSHNIVISVRAHEYDLLLTGQVRSL